MPINGTNPARDSPESSGGPVKTILFTYKSPVGTFWIRPEPAGRVQLGLDRRKLKIYKSPTAAARDVAMRQTGHQAWDSREGEPAPRDLHAWIRPPAVSKRRRSDATAPTD